MSPLGFNSPLPIPRALLCRWSFSPSVLSSIKLNLHFLTFLKGGTGCFFSLALREFCDFRGGPVHVLKHFGEDQGRPSRDTLT